MKLVETRPFNGWDLQQVCYGKHKVRHRKMVQVTFEDWSGFTYFYEFESYGQACAAIRDSEFLGSLGLTMGSFSILDADASVVVGEY